ncbi:40_t:CDS:2, partial [Racocetra fulgida]
LEKLNLGIVKWMKNQRNKARKAIITQTCTLTFSIIKVVIQPGNVLNAVGDAEETLKSMQKALSDLLLNWNDTAINELIANKKAELENGINMVKEASDNFQNKVNEDSIHAITDDMEKSIQDIDDQAKESRAMKRISDSIKKLGEQLTSLGEDIDGVQEYIDSLYVYIDYVDAQVDAEVDEKKKSEKLAKIKKTLDADNKKQQRLEKMIKKLELETKSQNDELKLLLFEHLVYTRYCMTIFMDKYCRAYKYWSLSESKLKLSVKEFHEININAMFRDLDEFFNSDQIALYIGHSDKFEDKDKTGKTYTFKLESSERGFESKERGFEYRVYNDYSHKFDIDQKYIDLDNIYYDERDKDYHFTPTPFSTWTIGLCKNDKGEYPNLSGLISINVHLM